MDQAQNYRTQEYEPGDRFTTVYWVFAVLVVSGGFLVMATTEYVEASSYLPWFWLASTIVGALVVPPLIQYVMLRQSGVQTTRKPWTAHNRVPYLFRWWNPEGRGLTKGQFVAAMGVPALVVWIILISYAIAEPISAGAIGLGLANFIGNFWYSALVLTKPRGTLIEEFEGGLRFHMPAGVGMLDSSGRRV